MHEPDGEDRAVLDALDREDPATLDQATRDPAAANHATRPATPDPHGTDPTVSQDVATSDRSTPDPGPMDPATTVARPRPVIERIGLAAVALLLAVLFGVMSVAAFVGGELFLAVMSGIGCVMVVWVGALTLLRGR